MVLLDLQCLDLRAMERLDGETGVPDAPVSEISTVLCDKMPSVMSLLVC